MADTIESIYYDYRSNFEDTSEFVLNFYNKNAILLNNTTTFNTKEELKMYIDINGKYLESIYSLGRYNDIIDTVDKKQPIIDKEITRLNAFELKSGWYYYLSFVKGMASYNLNDYKTSTPIFKALVSHDPKNELYKKWLDYSKYKRIEKYSAIGLIVSAIILVSYPFLKHTIPYLVMQSLLISGLIFLFVGSGYNYYQKRNLRRYK